MAQPLRWWLLLRVAALVLWWAGSAGLPTQAQAAEPAGAASTASAAGDSASAAVPKTAPCPGPPLVFKPLAPGLWWLPGVAGDADADNRGQVSNLVLAVEGPQVWLLGSGPTAAFGRALACQVRRQWGLPITDVVSPWPHPELVLGVAGLGPVRHWGHADVAAAMQQRCPHCVQRLRQQLGAAAVDVDAEPIRVPDLLLHGDTGRLGPWRWWKLSRGSGFPATVWQWRETPLRTAHGLLWAGGAPDARDADVQTLARSTQRLLQQPGAGRSNPPLRWLGEQGPPSADLPRQHRRYWNDLLQAVAAAQARGELETAPPAPPALLRADDPRHALNWQRAWRQMEAVAFQRSLR